MIRISIAGVSVLLAVITVIGLNLFLKGGETAGMLLVNKSSNEFVGISEQACMWVFFYLGLGELILRFVESGREERQVRRKLLPEDERVVLTSKEIPALYERSKKAGDSYLPRLIMRITRQFQASKSAAQANSVLDSSLDLFLHEIDLKYNLLRYIMWVIPTIGFIGTVRGIALGLSSAAAESKAGNSDDLLFVVSSDLSVAFYTTMLALIMSGVLVLLMHVCQGREESALNRNGQYCIDHLINKLYTPS